MGKITSGEATKVGGTEINLPTVYGANDALLKDIFGPAATLIGQQLAADLTRGRAEELGARERENLRLQTQHVADAQGLSPDPEPTRKQRSNLVDWIDEASDTNPDVDREGAAKWQAILGEILNRNDKTILDALSALNTFDVKTIHSLEKKGGKISSSQSAKLLSLGIIEKQNILENSRFLIFLGIGVTLVIFSLYSDTVLEYVAFGIKDYDSTVMFTRQASFMKLISVVYGLMSLVISFFILYRSLNRVTFTELGAEIKGKIDQYLK